MLKKLCSLTSPEVCTCVGKLRSINNTLLLSPTTTFLQSKQLQRSLVVLSRQVRLSSTNAFSQRIQRFSRDIPFRYLSQQQQQVQKFVSYSTISKPSGESNNNDDTTFPESSQSPAIMDQSMSKFQSSEAEAAINRLYERYSELQEFDRETIVKYLEVMTEFAFTIDIAVEMVLKYPPLLKIYEQKAPYIVAVLRSEGFSDKQRRALLYRHPRLFEISRNHINKRMSFLKSYCNNSEEAREIVMQSIESLVDNEHIIKAKLEYLIKSMSHDTKLIRDSSVLSHSLQHMKTRHEFLSRAGLYKAIPYYKLIKVQEKEKGSKVPRQKYFNPHDIVCTSDNEFLKICSKGALTLNELAAFEDIYSKQLLEHDEALSLLSDDEVEDDDLKSTISINSGGFSNVAEGDQFYF